MTEAFEGLLRPKTRPENTGSMMAFRDCEALYKAILRLGAKRILELGTGLGHSTLSLAFGAKEIGGHVTTVDIAQEGQITSISQAKSGLEQAKPLEFVTFVTSSDMRMEIPMGTQFDFIFLDTSHTY